VREQSPGDVNVHCFRRGQSVPLLHTIYMCKEVGPTLREYELKNNYDEYEEKLKRWESEGFDVSDLRQRWFGQEEASKTKKYKPRLGWIALIALIVVIVGIAVGVIVPTAGNDKTSGGSGENGVPYQRRYSLSASVNPAGSGSINLNPSGGSYYSGTDVTLTATASSSYEFSSWSGDASGTNPTTTITMNADKSVLANFTALTLYSLSTSVSPAGSGSVNLDPSGGAYYSGTDVIMTATPSSGYQFDYWGGDVTGSSSSTTITVDSDKDVIAHFKKLNQEIQYTMPSGSLVVSSVSYTKSLNAGEEVTGFAVLTGECSLGEWWSYEWHFQILGPGGESLHDWNGRYDTAPRHDFSFTASYEGRYKISVSHWSTCEKDLVIEVWPPGWRYAG